RTQFAKTSRLCELRPLFLAVPLPPEFPFRCFASRVPRPAARPLLPGFRLRRRGDKILLDAFTHSRIHAFTHRSFLGWRSLPCSRHMSHTSRTRPAEDPGAPVGKPPCLIRLCKPSRVAGAELLRSPGRLTV